MPLQIEQVPTSRLKPWDRNPRKNDEAAERLAGLIEAHGFINPIIASPDGTIRAGHTRWKAAKRLGLDSVPVVFVDFKSEAQAAAYALADNKSAEWAEWDFGALAGMLAELTVEVPLPELGFTPEELEALAAELPPLEGLTDPEDVPEIPSEPRTKRGDLWVLGAHRLLCGDSTSAEDVARLMGGQEADLIFTSPPYNADIKYASYQDKRERDDYLAFIESVVRCCVQALGEGRALAWNLGVSPKTCHLHQALLIEGAGLRFLRQIIWEKVGVPYPIFSSAPNLARCYRPNYQHEVIYLFSKGEPQEGRAIAKDASYQHDVWRYPASMATRDIQTVGVKSMGFKEQHGHCIKAHPAVYPVAIPAGGIKHLTAEGENVFDPFGGAGTTLIACEQLQRKSFSMEIDPQYCDLILARWEQFTGKSAELQKG